MVSRIAFQARTIPEGQNLRDGERDGSIAVEGASLGYRLYQTGNNSKQKWAIKCKTIIVSP